MPSYGHDRTSSRSKKSSKRHSGSRSGHIEDLIDIDMSGATPFSRGPYDQYDQYDKYNQHGRRSTRRRNQDYPGDPSSDSEISISNSLSNVPAFPHGGAYGGYASRDPRQRRSSSRKGGRSSSHRRASSDESASDSSSDSNSSSSGATAFSSDGSYGGYDSRGPRQRRSSSRKGDRSSSHRRASSDESASDNSFDSNLSGSPAYSYDYNNPLGGLPKSRRREKNRGQYSDTSDSDADSATSMGNNYDSDEMGGRSSKKYRQNRSHSLPGYLDRNDRSDSREKYGGHQHNDQNRASSRHIGSRLDNMAKNLYSRRYGRAGSSSGSESLSDQSSRLGPHGVAGGHSMHSPFAGPYSVTGQAFNQGNRYGRKKRSSRNRMPGAYESDSAVSVENDSLHIGRMGNHFPKSQRHVRDHTGPNGNRSSLKKNRNKVPGMPYGRPAYDNPGLPHSGILPPLGIFPGQTGNAGYPGQFGIHGQDSFNPLPDYSYEDGAVKFQNRRSRRDYPSDSRGSGRRRAEYDLKGDYGRSRDRRRSSRSRSGEDHDRKRHHKRDDESDGESRRGRSHSRKKTHRRKGKTYSG